MRPGPPTLPVLFVAGTLLPVATPPAAQERQPPTPADYRHSVMEGMQNHVDALRSLLDGVVDHPDHVLLHAQAIRSLSLMVPDIWPEGSAEGTRALPEIWANWTDFMTRIDAFQEATATLSAVAESGDMEATSEAAGNVQRACRSCHGEYRARALSRASPPARTGCLGPGPSASPSEVGSAAAFAIQRRIRDRFGGGRLGILLAFEDDGRPRRGPLQEPIIRPCPARAGRRGDER